MANFGQFLAKMGETGFFFKKAVGTFFSHLKALINCKVSEKSNEGIPRNRVADERTNEGQIQGSYEFFDEPKSNERFSSNRVTYGRTDARESLGLQRLRRETKNLIFETFKEN